MVSVFTPRPTKVKAIVTVNQTSDSIRDSLIDFFGKPLLLELISTELDPSKYRFYLGIDSFFGPVSISKLLKFEHTILTYNLFIQGEDAPLCYPNKCGLT